MRTRRIGWRYGLVGVGLVTAAAVAVVAGAAPSLRAPWFPKRHPLAKVPTAVVRRTDLSVSMTAAGEVRSSERTVVECELEALSVGVKGNRINTNGASTLLSVIPDGSDVKKGDVLAVLDSSDYEELLRTQRINVDRARADHRQAELVLDVARTAVNEYREGLLKENVKTMEGQIALAESDFERAKSRLVWSRRMGEKGYVPLSQVAAEEFQAKQMEVALTRSRTKLRVFKRWDAPLYLRILESEVYTAESQLSYQDRRLERFEERLANLESQVEACTIRAPHDGFVIYANDPRRQVQIEPGMAVRQRQDLFFLPNLAKMEVSTSLHETVVKDVRPGMLARVKVEALDNRVLEGHVKSVAQLPDESNRWFSDVKFFIGVVTLDTIPRGLRPGMTAEVEIQAVRRPDVLAIPSAAVTYEGGHDVCYVARDDHLERREVKLGQSSTDLLEVVEGLEEGDEVVTDPSLLDDSLVIVDVPAPAAPAAESSPLADAEPVESAAE